MAASLNQDFVTYSGDDIAPIFTVINAAGIAVDISTVTEITWSAVRDDSTATVLTKTKSAGQITFVTTGADGQFQVAITKTDTAALSGYYIHTASVTDGSGNITTVTVGRLQVGLQPTWTYNPAQLATNTVYQVRRLIGDVLYGDQQMQDEEIKWLISTYPNVWAAASAAASTLAAQFSRLVDTVQGEMRTLYGQRAKNYMALAASLLMQSKGRSGPMAYAGGISNMDKEQQVEDPDRVPPVFSLRMFDNTLPTSPIGQQALAAPAPEASI